jgi:type IV pilus assembly protein PilV
MVRFASPRGARGVSMIEVLVAIVIFSLGLLGLALMQLKGANFTKDSAARSVAVLQARSLADRMQANPTGVTNGDYVWAGGTPPTYTDCSSTACGPSQVADNDINAWLTQMQASLPASAGTSAAMGQVLDNGDGTYTIKVQWNGLGIVGSGSETDSFVYVPRAGG